MWKTDHYLFVLTGKKILKENNPKRGQAQTLSGYYDLKRFSSFDVVIGDIRKAQYSLLSSCFSRFPFRVWVVWKPALRKETEKPDFRMLKKKFLLGGKARSSYGVS